MAVNTSISDVHALVKYSYPLVKYSLHPKIQVILKIIWRIEMAIVTPIYYLYLSLNDS